MAKQLFSADDFVNKESFEKLQKSMLQFFAAMDAGFKEFGKVSEKIISEQEKIKKSTESLYKELDTLSKSTLQNSRVTKAQREEFAKLESQILNNLTAYQKYNTVLKGNEAILKEEKKKIDEVKKSYEKAKESVENSGKAQEKKTNQTRNLSKELSALKKKYENLSDAERETSGNDLLRRIEKINSELAERRKEIKRVTDAQKEAEKAAKERAKEEAKAAKLAEKSAKEQTTAYGRLKAEYREAANVAKELSSRAREVAEKQGKSSKAFKELAIEAKKASKRAKELSDDLKDIEGNVGQFQRNVGNYASAFSGLTDVFGNTAGEAGGVIDTLGGIDLAGGAAVAGITILITGIVTLTQQLSKATKEQERFATLTNKTGEELQDFTANAQALASTFALDVDKVGESLSRAETVFGIDGKQAFDILSKGLIQAGARAEEVLENVEQFGQNAKALGFTFEEFIAISSTAVQKGAKDVDRVGDLVNNARTELQRLKAVDLKGILSAEDLREADKVLTDFQSGAIKGTKAVEFFSQKIIDLGVNSREGGELLTKVFTGVGEEGFSVELLESFTDIDGAVEGLTKNLTQAEKKQIELIVATRDANEALLEISAAIGFTSGGFAIAFQRIKEAVFEAVLFVIESLQNAKDRFQAIFEVIFGGADEVGQALDGVKTALNTILDVLGVVFDAVSNAGGVFAPILEGAQFTTALFKAIGGTAERIFGIDIPNYFEVITNALSEVYNFFQIVFNGLSTDWDNFILQLSEFSPFLSELFIPFAGILETISGIFSDLGKKLSALIPDELIATIGVFKEEFANAYNDITKRQKELSDAREADKKAEQERQRAATDAAEKEIKNTEKLTKKKISSTKSVNNELIKARQDLANKLLEIEIVRLESEIEKEDLSLVEKVKLANQLGVKKQELAKQQATFDKENASREIANAEELAITVQSIETESAETVRVINKETADQIKKFNQEILDQRNAILEETKSIEGKISDIRLENAELESEAFIQSLKQQIVLNQERLDNEKLSQNERLALLQQNAELERKIIAETERVRLESLEKQRLAEITQIKERIAENKVLAEKSPELVKELTAQNETLQEQINEINKKYASERLIIQQETAEQELDISNKTAAKSTKVLEENAMKRRELLGEILGGGALDAYEKAENERISNIENENERVRAQFALKLKMMALEIALAKLKNPDANVENQVAGLGRAGAGGLLSALGGGLFEGGYTGDKALFVDKNGREAVDFVHKNEWVASEKLTKANPKTSRIIESLEGFQRTGNEVFLNRITNGYENFNTELQRLKLENGMRRESQAIDYDKLGATLAKYIPEVSIKEKADSHIFQKRTDQKLRIIEVQERVNRYRF